MGHFNDFVWWVFCGLISGCFVYGVALLQKLIDSISTLNEQVAKILEKTAWHEKELIRHEERIGKIEDKM